MAADSSALLITADSVSSISRNCGSRFAAMSASRIISNSVPSRNWDGERFTATRNGGYP